MSKVSRSSIYPCDERGGDWFQEFLKSMAYPNQPSSVQDILNSITNKRSETVESVVKSYREQVGLDTISSDEDGQVKTASVEDRPLSKRDGGVRYLSVRHASEPEGHEADVPKLSENKELLQLIDSFCEHSGGTKNTPSIINHLRKITDGDIGYTYKELRDYIEKRKNHFSEGEEQDNHVVGLVGQDKTEDYGDDIADYQTYNGAK